MKLRFLSFLAVAAVVLAGCSTPKPAQTTPVEPTTLYRYPMTPNGEKLAQYMAAHDLKDPDSAKFRDAFFITADPRGDARDRSKDSWCVEVNGKNSYGAYTGYTWALLPAGTNKMIQGGTMAAMVNDICSKSVYGPVTLPTQTPAAK